MPRARIAVVSMHTSPTASLGESANGGMNVYIRGISAAFSRCGIATDVFTRRVGADDPAVSRDDIALLTERIPDSRLVETPDARHLANVDRPDAFDAAVLGFLA